MFVNITLRRKMRDERDHFNKSDLVHDDVAVCREGQPVLDDLQPSLRPNPDELLDGKCSPLSLVEVKRGSALIGRELQSVAGASNLMPAILCHKEPGILRSKAPSRGL